VSGEVRELDIPSSEAYGDKGMPSFQIPPGSDLVFEIEVLKID
jgi:FKBP-type peptidyl-prolyl cis-trans isomerase